MAQHPPAPGRAVTSQTAGGRAGLGGSDGRQDRCPAAPALSGSSRSEASRRRWPLWRSRGSCSPPSGRCCASTLKSGGRPPEPGGREPGADGEEDRPAAEGGDVDSGGGEGRMNGSTFWRSRDGSMRQRRFASPTREHRLRSLPTKQGHAALPLATREYENDTTSSNSRSSILRHPGVGIFARPPP